MVARWSFAILVTLLALASAPLRSSAVSPVRSKLITQEQHALPTATAASAAAPWWSFSPGVAQAAARGVGMPPASLAKDPPQQPECMWEVGNYSTHDAIRAWEFQAQPHRHMVRDRERAIERVEKLLRQLSADPHSDVTWVPGSRWMAIFQETAFQVSTRHGHPLHPRDKEEKHSTPFPWKKLAYLRLRRYKILTPGGAYVPTAQPGMADVTLKMKAVDPDVGLGELQLPQQVGASKLTAKMEWDGHCDHGRVSMSPLFKPVSQEVNVSTAAGVQQFFPNLASVARISEDEVLPFMHEVYRAKIVWTVVFAGVVGEANLVIKYNTTFQDAVAGTRPKNGEVSLRIRRDVAEATGTVDWKRLLAGLDAVGRAMQAFRDNGWDGKTPSWNDDSASTSNGCGCKHCHCCGRSDEASASTSNACGCKHCHCCGSSVEASASISNTCGCKHCHCCGSSVEASTSNGCGCKCGCCKREGFGGAGMSFVSWPVSVVRRLARF